MSQYGLEQVPVLSEGRLVGMLNRDSIFTSCSCGASLELEAVEREALGWSDSYSPQ